MGLDPITNLRRQRELAREIIRLSDGADDGTGQRLIDLEDAANDLAEAVIDLDNWRLAGGFDPYVRRGAGD